MSDLADRVALALSTSRHKLIRAAPEGIACICGQYDDSDHGIEAAELWRDHLVAAALAALDPLPSPADRAEPEPAMPDSPETWDEADGMCPNCVTPWKCNGPHLDEQTVASRRRLSPSPANPIEARS